jgi:O-antigen/teichoic acid export membrane protein
MNLGVKFFFLQIVALIIFSSSNIIIAQLFAPEDVVPYSIAFKYYNLVTMLFSMVLTPFWSAYTDAYTRGDHIWIRRTIDVLKRAWLVAAAVVIVMSVFANDFYRFWVGSDIVIPLEMSLVMGVYVLIIAWSNIYANFINGTGKVRLQMYFAAGIGAVNIPLAVALASYSGLGIVGVVLAPCLCLLPGCFVWPVQVRRILSGTAEGVWGK